MQRTIRIARLACLALIAVPLSAQTRITGVVKEDSSNRPLPFAEVGIEKSARLARTDSAGRYVLDSPSGTQIVLFKLVGYRPLRVRVNVKQDDTTQVDAAMVPDRGGRTLDPVSVTGRMPVRGLGRDGFEVRRANGLGKFIDSTELRRAEGRNLADFLRGSTGVRMVEFRNQTAFIEVRAASPIQLGMDGSPNCWVSVIYDNVTIYKTGSRSPPPDFRKDFSVQGLDAIEYYKNRAETPQEFSGLGDACGVMVLWSRRGR